MIEKKRILVIDDDAAVARVITRFLETTGLYEARSLTEPQRAVEIARHFRPDLVVLDIIMPTMDGGEVLAALQSEAGLTDLRVIFLTGLVSESEIGPEGHQVGGHPCMPKPVHTDLFRATVAELLETPDAA